MMGVQATKSVAEQEDLFKMLKPSDVEKDAIMAKIFPLFGVGVESKVPANIATWCVHAPTHPRVTHWQHTGNTHVRLQCGSAFCSCSDFCLCL